jgi:hypothetical protein
MIVIYDYHIFIVQATGGYHLKGASFGRLQGGKAYHGKKVQAFWGFIVSDKQNVLQF